MPQVVVTIDGKTYRMACGPGEEDHLHDLASGIEEKIQGLKDGVGQIGDQRLTIMAAIMTADELADAQNRINTLEDENQTLKSKVSSLEDRMADLRNRCAKAMDKASHLMETLASRIS
ncbi:cell division protein ZapA [Fulvimarina sp. MAC8]|uniref:cell division protein ZapA n=1 Tax=Fulvimarina sp. MAC8 TaxID=3162874 RepID=UPI0032EFBD68